MRDHPRGERGVAPGRQRRRGHGRAPETPLGSNLDVSGEGGVGSGPARVVVGPAVEVGVGVGGAGPSMPSGYSPSHLAAPSSPRSASKRPSQETWMFPSLPVRKRASTIWSGVELSALSVPRRDHRSSAPAGLTATTAGSKSGSPLGSVVCTERPIQVVPPSGCTSTAPTSWVGSRRGRRRWSQGRWCRPRCRCRRSRGPRCRSGPSRCRRGWASWLCRRGRGRRGGAPAWPAPTAPRGRGEPPTRGVLDPGSVRTAASLARPQLLSTFAIARPFASSSTSLSR